MDEARFVDEGAHLPHRTSASLGYGGTMKALSDFAGDTMRGMALLTRLRVHARWFEGFDGRYDRAARAFPLVGAAVGLLVAIVASASVLAGLSPVIAAILAAAAGIVTTGALHEDGLADTADGLGGRDAERRLAIMRDSAIGVYGVLALGGVLALKAAAVASLVASPILLIAALVAAGGASRASMVWLWNVTDPARADGAAAASGRPTRRATSTAIALAALLCAPAVLIAGPWTALAALGAIVLVAVSLRRHARALGGHTGDVLGACALLSETVVLVVLASASPAAPPTIGLAAATSPPDMVAQ